MANTALKTAPAPTAAPQEAAPSSEGSASRFLEWEEGTNRVWLTSIKLVAGTPEKPRAKVQLTFSLQPTAETFTSPFTTVSINLPGLPDDTQAGRIFMDRQIKAILYPLAELQPDAKAKMSEILTKIKESLQVADYLCDVEMKSSEGNQIDNRTGEPRKFWNINSLTPLEGREKGIYESDIDMSDLSF